MIILRIGIAVGSPTAPHIHGQNPEICTQMIGQIAEIQRIAGETMQA
nr:hypothetical protein [Iodidimonas nitroreducens]